MLYSKYIKNQKNMKTLKIFNEKKQNVSKLKIPPRSYKHKHIYIKIFLFWDYITFQQKKESSDFIEQLTRSDKI